LNLPWRSSRLQPFALVGAGIMQFNPISSGTSVWGTQSQTKPAVLWGAGVNYDLSRHFALRFEYRGLFYAGPDFKVASLKTDRWQPMSQPSFGIVYRF
jgi:opacity protein-like surface antigen